MPVTTSVYIHDPVDYRIVFAKCAMLIGASARTRTGDDGGMIFTTTDQGQLAWTWVEYGNDGPPLRTAAVPHTAQHAPGCAGRHAPACWIEAVFDAEDGYRDDHGGPGALNQRLVTALGQWLDDQAVRWSWRTHDDGILHDGQDGLAGLAALDG
jgi:hypothetical protein